MAKGYAVEDKVNAFSDFLKNLVIHSSIENQEKRLGYARKYTYSAQIGRVEQKMNELFNK
jgi:hypothetical protein